MDGLQPGALDELRRLLPVGSRPRVHLTGGVGAGETFLLVLEVEDPTTGQLLDVGLVTGNPTIREVHLEHPRAGSANDRDR